MLDRLQSEYSFPCDMLPDPDNEKYIRYMAPLSYNGSLKVNSSNFGIEFVYLNEVNFHIFFLERSHQRRA